jgi:hypothetical protein
VATTSSAVEASAILTEGNSAVPGGAGQAEDRSAMPIREVSTTPMGKYLVELENGELWRQRDSDSTRIALPADRSQLTAEFRDGFMGSTTITISGTYRAFKASRVNDKNN